MEGGGINLGLLVAAGIGILALAVVFMLGPVSKISQRVKRLFYRDIGGQMEAAMPALSATSAWNASYNTGLKTGADVWESGDFGSVMSPMAYITLHTHTVPDHRRVGYPGSDNSSGTQRSRMSWSRPPPGANSRIAF